MSKKKIKLIIWILVLVLVVGTIFYLNRTIKGDFISENLRESGVARITYHDIMKGIDSPKIELSNAKIESFLKLFEDTEFKKIYSNSVQINGSNMQDINCYNARGSSLAYFRMSGEDYLFVHLTGDRSEFNLRIKTEGWYEEFKKIIEG